MHAPSAHDYNNESAASGILSPNKLIYLIAAVIAFFLIEGLFSLPTMVNARALDVNFEDASMEQPSFLDNIRNLFYVKRNEEGELNQFDEARGATPDTTDAHDTKLHLRTSSHNSLHPHHTSSTLTTVYVTHTDVVVQTITSTLSLSDGTSETENISTTKNTSKTEITNETEPTTKHSHDIYIHPGTSSHNSEYNHHTTSTFTTVYVTETEVVVKTVSGTITVEGMPSHSTHDDTEWDATWTHHHHPVSHVQHTHLRPEVTGALGDIVSA
jgi:hypothetical protein